MKNEIAAAVHKVFELGLDLLDKYDGEKAWMNAKLLNTAFSDVPLKIDKYSDNGYCFAHLEVDNVAFKICLKVTELQEHNIKALKGAA